MRGLLIVLCALVTGAAALAGGCAFLFTGLGAAAAVNRREEGGLLMITVPVLGVTAALVIVNVALIVALSRGGAPRRNVWFLLLAVVDFAIAALLVGAGASGQGPVDFANLRSLFLPVALALKGLLTLLLPAEPPPLPPARGGA